MSLPLSLQLYRALVWLAAPFSGWILRGRARRGKEDPKRLTERFGRTQSSRPEGQLLWLHGASVGESLILLELVRRLSETTNWHFLITTGTTSSARLVAESLPERGRHQFIPIDRLATVRRFLDHWTPDAAVFVESELWPNLLLDMQGRRIPAALVNARMNQKSLTSWHQRTNAAARLLSTFKWVGAADERTADGLSELTGNPIPCIGNLKLQIAAPNADPDELISIRETIGARPVWLAASTHDGEEAILLEAHRFYREAQPNALLILAPRHPERGDEITDLIGSAGQTHVRRSLGDVPDAETSVWLADTLGEMALWYALVDQAFIGGSLLEEIGGHNPIEATQADCPIVTGPHTASFDDVFDAYKAKGGVIIAATAASISEALRVGPQDRLQGAQNALRELTGSAMDETLNAILSLLPEDQQ